MECSTVNTPPTPTGSLLFPPGAAPDFERGPADASVTLLLYCDFQSAECELFNQVLDQLIDAHGDDLKVVFRPFGVPTAVVPSLDKSELAVRAALAAADQGKFWPVRDHLHGHYDEWRQLSPADFQSWLERQAMELSLEPGRFKADLNSASTAARARSLYEFAMTVGISGIPTVFINNQLQSRPALSYDGLESTIRLTTLGARQFTSCPTFDIDPSRQYLARLRTEKGDITIRLDADHAPMAVNSFIFLARQGWFDGTTFHRVIPGFLAQAGDPSETGLGGPGYYFRTETSRRAAV